jgi:ribonuclease Y
MTVAVVLSVVIGVLALAIGALLGYTVKIRIGKGQVLTAERDAGRILAEAEARQKETLLEAKEEAIRVRAQVEAEVKERRDEVLRLERRITSKEENLDRKVDALEQREQALASKEEEAQETRAKLDELHRQQIQEIERVSGLSSQE